MPGSGPRHDRRDECALERPDVPERHCPIPCRIPGFVDLGLGDPVLRSVYILRIEQPSIIDCGDDSFVGLGLGLSLVRGVAWIPYVNHLPLEKRQVTLA